jgi:hypothetical protein
LFGFFPFELLGSLYRTSLRCFVNIFSNSMCSLHFIVCGCAERIKFDTILCACFCFCCLFFTSFQWNHCTDQSHSVPCFLLICLQSEFVQLKL